MRDDPDTVRALWSLASLALACTGESKPTPGPTAMEVAAAALAPPAQGTQVVVEVELPGASPSELEAQVVLPLEHALMASATAIDAIAWSGHARVTVTLPAGTDQSAASALVRDALPTHALPSAALAPVVRRSPPGHGVLFVIADELATDPAAADLVLERIGPIAGVSSVVRCGGRGERARVQLDPAALAAFGVDADAVIDAVDATDIGALQTPPAAAMVAQLAATKIGPVVLGEVARVVVASVPSPCATLATDGRQPYIVQIRGDDGGLAHVGAVLDELVRSDPRLRNLRRFGPGPDTVARVWPSAPLHEHRHALAAWLSRSDGGPAWLLQEGPEDAWVLGDAPAASSRMLHVHRGAAPLWARVCGAAFDLLPDAANRVAGALAGDATLHDVVARVPTMLPRVRVDIDRDALARRGVSITAVQRVLPLLSGEPLRLALGAAEVALAPGVDPKTITLRGSEGALVPLAVLVAVSAASEPGAIRHIDAMRCIEVELDATDATDRAAIASRLQREVQLPRGVVLTLP